MISSSVYSLWSLKSKSSLSCINSLINSKQFFIYYDCIANIGKKFAAFALLVILLIVKCYKII